MTRDFTSAQFNAALKRNGFRWAALWWFVDTTGACPNIHFSGIFYRNGKCARRATLAHLIKRREEEDAKTSLGKAQL